jgi:hypothetical protein
MSSVERLIGNFETHGSRTPRPGSKFTQLSDGDNDLKPKLPALHHALEGGGNDEEPGSAFRISARMVWKKLSEILKLTAVGPLDPGPNPPNSAMATTTSNQNFQHSTKHQKVGITMRNQTLYSELVHVWRRKSY